MSSLPDASMLQILCTTDLAPISRAASALSPWDLASDGPSAVRAVRADLGLVTPATALVASASEVLASGRVPLIVGAGLCALVEAVGEPVGEPVGVLHLAAEPQLGDGERGSALLSSAAVSRIVGVGYRHGRAADVVRSKAAPRHFPFWDHELALRRAEGASWKRLCEGMIAVLPQRVVVGVELSGLSPSVCPGAGAPLGGLSWADLAVLLWLLGERKAVVGLSLRWREAADPSGCIGAELIQKLASCAQRSRAGR